MGGEEGVVCGGKTKLIADGFRLNPIASGYLRSCRAAIPSIDAGNPQRL